MVEINPIKDTADVIRGVVDSEVGKAALMPVAQQTGRALGTVGEAVNAVLIPLRGLVWGMEKIETWVRSVMEEKLKGIPPERLITPKPNIAGPIIESMRFVGEEPELREMFANLLATSMDSATANNAHPAFAEIIRQMTGDEARIAKLILTGARYPLVSVLAEDIQPPHAFVHVLTHFSLIGEHADCSSPLSIAHHLDNICRLGLAQIPLGMTLIDKQIYNSLEQNHIVLSAAAAADKRVGKRSKIEREYVEATVLGRVFHSVCIHSSEDSINIKDNY